MDAIMELDKAYIPTRNPNTLPTDSPKDRYTKTESERLTDYAAKIMTLGFYKRWVKPDMMVILLIDSIREIVNEY